MSLLPYGLLVPFVVQGLLMLVDEFYYHHKRGLPLWEVLGHPLDTLTVIAPLVYALTRPFSQPDLVWFVALAALSGVFIVKDEWVHKSICPAGEMALHALLFGIHPLIFASFAYLWYQGGLHIADTFISFQSLALGQLCILGVFFLYQGIYWGLRSRGRNKQCDL